MADSVLVAYATRYGSTRHVLRRMGVMEAMLNEIIETIDRLRPYELWIRYHTEGALGYGSLALFLAERSGLDLETATITSWALLMN